MKVNGIFIAFSLAVFLAGGSCKKQEASDESLKDSLSRSTGELAAAVEAISSSPAYSLLTIDGADTKSVNTEDEYRVNIPLSDIKGVYEYSPSEVTNGWGISLIRFFRKTADDEKMIVKMPLKKVERPLSLRHFSSADAELANNFSIAVSEYYNNYNSFLDFDYLMESEISIDDVSAGMLNIKSFISPEEGRKYASQYEFTDGYTAKYTFESTDKSVYTFAIEEEGKVLYSEERSTVRNNTVPFSREHYYILRVGNVKIIRKSGLKDVEVYVDDVLQSEAVVEIIDPEEDQEASVCRKRDIQITFDDGTTATLSSLIGESVGNIRVLYSSLRQVYLAAYVVDWIAYDIYYKRN